MKNLYTKNEFLSHREESELINEGFIGKMFKSLWKGVSKLAKRIKGSTEISKAYDKYKGLVDQAFSKMGNVEAAGNASEVAASTKNNPEAPAEAAEAPEGVKVSTKSNESLIVEADEAPIQGDTKNTEEQKNLVNLTPEKIAKVSALTEDRIKELRKQFDTDINQIITRLSKNPEYSSDKLKQYSNVMKNQFNSYVYNQWYGFYQKAGDQNKLVELTKVKKENEVKFKQSLEELNTVLGEQQSTLQVLKGKTYTYFSKNNNADINVKVIGKAVGQDEKGQPDAENNEHDAMWKVKSDGGDVFWVSPSSFKKEIAAAPKSLVKKADIVVGAQFIYTKKDGQPGTATVVKGEDGKPIIDEKSNVTVSGGKTKFPINISKLRPK